MAKKKVKVGKEKALPKDHKKVPDKDIMGDPPEEKEGEKVESKPAHVPETMVTVRGTAVGGTRKMTKSEHDKWCEEQRKKK